MISIPVVQFILILSIFCFHYAVSFSVTRAPHKTNGNTLFKIHRYCSFNKHCIHSTRKEIVVLQSQSDSTDSDYIDEDALIKRINEEIFADCGAQLDDLINPSKVVNLERDLIQLNKQLEQAASSSEIDEITKTITKKKANLSIEKRSVMRGWLKNLFVFQSVLAGVISLFMVYDAVPGQSLPLSVRVLGFWMWWLFIVPSLRARKPSSKEKEALNIAFLLTPVVSVAMPSITKDVAVIWWANAAVVALSYAYAYGFAKTEETSASSMSTGTEGSSEEEAKTLPSFLIQAFKALDYGSGQERGTRK